jgi:hypothetical protein
MKNRNSRWAILPAIALGALFAGLPAAQAFDQQATTAEMDNELNWRAASGTGFTGGYAQVPARHRALRQKAFERGYPIR